MEGIITTQNLVQAGSTLIALVLVYAYVKLSKTHSNHFMTLTREFIGVMRENTKALTELKDTIKSLNHHK